MRLLPLSQIRPRFYSLTVIQRQVAARSDLLGTNGSRLVDHDDSPELSHALSRYAIISADRQKQSPIHHSSLLLCHRTKCGSCLPWTLTLSTYNELRASARANLSLSRLPTRFASSYHTLRASVPDLTLEDHFVTHWLDSSRTLRCRTSQHALLAQLSLPSSLPLHCHVLTAPTSKDLNPLDTDEVIC